MSLFIVLLEVYLDYINFMLLIVDLKGINEIICGVGLWEGN